MDNASPTLNSANSGRNAIPQSDMVKSEGSGWTHFDIASIECLSDAVLGADLEAMQLSRAPVSGSLAFFENSNVLFSTGFIGGRVALAGPLSQNLITLGFGLNFPSGTRHWLSEVTTGTFGVFLPGDEHDAVYPPGSHYATITLTGDRLEEVAKDRGLVVSARALGTGLHARRVPHQVVARLRTQFERVHLGHGSRASNAAALGDQLVDAIIRHVGREPRPPIGRIDPRGHIRIVARARAYIIANLEQPLRIDDLAEAACASRSTLHRAFSKVLDETPHAYVRKLRLHRIRHDLASDAERACTVALVANRWGIGELGRLSGSYRELFGERPSETLAKGHQRFLVAAG